MPKLSRIGKRVVHAVFGFVTFENDADAEKAISEMDSHELDGRKIRVNEANQDRARSGRRNNYRGNGRSADHE